MTKRKIQTPGHGADRKSVDRAMKIFAAMMDERIAPELHSAMIEWFGSPSDWDVKGQALEEYMHRTLVPASAPDRRTLRSKEEFLRVHGAVPAVKPKARPLRRRIYSRAAAAAVAMVLALSGAFLGEMFFGEMFPGGDAGDVTAQVETMVVEAAEGTAKEIVLPCGSTVRLNAGGRLSYPPAIVNGERRVKLEGEAWFDVTHDAACPFFVGAHTLDVRVFGTKFNVHTTPANTSIRLDEGVVEVRAGERTMKLEPGQELHYDDETGEMRVDKTAGNGDAGHIYINGRTMPEILRTAGDFYGTKINFETSDFPDHDEYSINLDREQSLESVLGVLSILSNGFTFERQSDGTVTIICVK